MAVRGRSAAGWMCRGPRQFGCGPGAWRQVAERDGRIRFLRRLGGAQGRGMGRQDEMQEGPLPWRWAQEGARRAAWPEPGVRPRREYNAAGARRTATRARDRCRKNGG